MSDRIFIPYGSQWIDEEDIAAVVSVLRSDFLTQGPRIQQFEKAITDYTGARYCVAFANGTAALHCAVNALDLEDGSEGITSTNTFVASANCMAYNRVRPVLADIDKDTFNVTADSLQARLHATTRLLIPVHFAGQPCDMPEISNLAQKTGCYIIEDAAHAIGSKYEDGSLVGNCRYSDMTVFSFHPVKTLTTGEGGAVTTNNEKLYHKLLLFRSHGITKDPDKLQQNPGPWYYEQHELGFNYRITDLQCVLGLQQFKKLESFIKRRKEIVSKYNKALQGINNLKVPRERERVESCFHLYVLQIDFQAIGRSRTMIMNELKNKGIGSQVHYIPVHTQPWYQKEFGYKWGDCPVAEQYYSQSLSIPLYPRMTDTEVTRVIEGVKEVVLI